MFCRKQDAVLRIDRESPHSPGHTTGQSELARGVEKKKHLFADTVTLGARPQANPLRDGQILTGTGAADGALNVERDGNRLHRLAVACGTARDGGDGTGKNCTRSAS